MFGGMMTDKVTLIKKSGETFENIRANVQSKMIFIDDASVPIEEGDKLTRELPNKLIESYLVIDRGFYSAMGGIKAHYQVKVQKESTYANRNGSASINNFYGNVNNAQIQQNVQNSSQSIVIDEGFIKKEELTKYIKTLKENIEQVGLEAEQVTTVSKNIEVIEGELKKDVSKSRVIIESLSTIRNILEGVAGGLIASGLIYQLGLFIK